MIKIENANVKFNGSVKDLLAEASAMLGSVCVQISKETDMEFKDVMEIIVDNARLFPLFDAGMNSEEVEEIMEVENEAK